MDTYLLLFLGIWTNHLKNIQPENLKKYIYRVGQMSTSDLFKCEYDNIILLTLVTNTL